MRRKATGTFDVDLVPGEPELDGAVRRFHFTKTFRGDLAGSGAGVMLSTGDPASGSAGYVAVERLAATLGDRTGEFVLQQMGLMHAGAQTLVYEVAPGSGEGGLEGIVGTFHLDVDDDGTHRYELDYEL